MRDWRTSLSGSLKWPALSILSAGGLVLGRLSQIRMLKRNMPQYFTSNHSIRNFFFQTGDRRNCSHIMIVVSTLPLFDHLREARLSSATSHLWYGHHVAQTHTHPVKVKVSIQYRWDSRSCKSVKWHAVRVFWSCSKWTNYRYEQTEYFRIQLCNEANKWSDLILTLMLLHILY